VQKSFWGDERNFLELLMRLICGDVRVLIVSHKSDHRPPHRRYRAPQRGRPRIGVGRESGLRKGIERSRCRGVRGKVA
jgi:hypothetical protein